MSATYDNELPTDKDHVRFLVGDTDTTAALLSDEEIAALLNEESATGAAKKYYAAANALSVLVTRWASAGAGLLEKKASKLTLRWGTEAPTQAALQGRIADLRRQGSLKLAPQLFKAL